MNDNKGVLYFITGLSGAGKTTIGTLFYEQLKQKNPATVLLDGDIIRETYNEDCGYTEEERKRAAFRTCRVSKLLTDQGISVVLCCIEMYDEVRDLHREVIENYKEIYLRVSKETLMKRDKKGLYSGKSGQSNVVGVDMPAEEPKCPDIVIDNNGEKTPEEVCKILLDNFVLNL